jgi:hypothetical protein
MLEAVDVTKAGKKIAPPTPDNPTYYYPVFLGYKALGGDEKFYTAKPEDEGQIKRELIATLARQGYIVASKHAQPSLVIVFQWGSVTPLMVDAGRGGYCTNASEIRAYVVGERVRDLDPHSAFYREMMSLEARHYLLVSAFEYKSARKGKDILLWRAHVTTDLWGNYLHEVINTMIAHAGPILGRDLRPGAAWSPQIPHVRIGTPRVVP